MKRDWRDSRKFRRWAEGRSQLEIMRMGWGHAGPWFTCTDRECPGVTEYGFEDHCFSVIEGDHSTDDTTYTLHVCTYADVARHRLIVLCITDMREQEIVRVAQ